VYNYFGARRCYGSAIEITVVLQQLVGGIFGLRHDGRRRFEVIVACGSSLSHARCIGNCSFVLHNIVLLWNAFSRYGWLVRLHCADACVMGPVGIPLVVGC
jgi:hypothetical protein